MTLRKFRRHWIVLPLLAAGCGVLLLLACGRVVRSFSVNLPDGHLRHMAAVTRTVPEKPGVSIEEAGQADLPSSALRLIIEGKTLYAPMAFQGLATFDLSDPLRPRLTDRQPGMLQPDDPESRVILSVFPDPKRERILVMDRMQGLVVYDASEPSRPKLQWAKSFPGGPGDRPMNMARAGDYYYFACGGAGLRVLPVNFDPDTPAEPVLRGFDHTRDCVFFPPRWLLVSDGYDTGMQVLDIDHPTSPRAVHVVQTATYCDQIVPVGHYVVTSNRSLGFVVFDMRNPRNPVLVNHYNLLSNLTIKALGLWRNRFLIAGMQTTRKTGLIEIFDLRDPAAPIVVARLETDAEVNTLFVQGDLLYAGLWKLSKMGIYRLACVD